LAKSGYNLERKLRRDLNSARSAAAQKGIANTHVTGGRDLVATVANLTVAVHVKAATTAQGDVRCGIGNEGRQNRVGEVRMVKNIEEICAQLHFHPLGDRGVLKKREVPLLVGWSYERIAAQAPEVPGARHAI
jgi:hypothetical protein